VDISFRRAMSFGSTTDWVLVMKYWKQGQPWPVAIGGLSLPRIPCELSELARKEHRAV